MNKDLLTVIVGGVIVAVAAIAAITIYNINDRNNMSKNIEAAIANSVVPSRL